ncbi:conserved protein of unknown function [Tenacibaculum sp. 190130A14a]|uniref:Uncharacterized protein n=1 Tax=Tenacibaculum polynesiense TaxID=3137857 RepID=A0ABM9P7T1_9FLAO
MDFLKLIEIKKQIEKIEKDPNSTEFEKFCELLILKEKLEEERRKKNTQKNSGFNRLFGLS